METGPAYACRCLTAGLRPTRCDRGPRGRLPSRLARRGRAVRPIVYLDEAPLAGGLEHLEAYRPDDLHLLEVYAEGLEIRLYTRQFMERMARRPVPLIPINIGDGL